MRFDTLEMYLSGNSDGQEITLRVKDGVTG